MARSVSLIECNRFQQSGDDRCRQKHGLACAVTTTNDRNLMRIAHQNKTHDAT